MKNTNKNFLLYPKAIDDMRFILDGFHFVARRSRSRTAECTTTYMSSEASEQQRRGMKADEYYSLKHFGHELAIEYSRKLEIGLKKITDSPEVARKCDYIRHGLHAINIESHIIFFKIKNNQPNIIRILHKSMDYIRHL